MLHQQKMKRASRSWHVTEGSHDERRDKARNRKNQLDRACANAEMEMAHVAGALRDMRKSRLYTGGLLGCFLSTAGGVFGSINVLHCCAGASLGSQFQRSDSTTLKFDEFY